MSTLTENELYYLRSIKRHLEEVRDAMADTSGLSLGSMALADNLNWLDCFIDQHERASPLPAPAPAGEWQTMATEPNDGEFRFYGLHVSNRRTGFRWFEVHYVALDDTGQLVEPSGDSFSDWAFDDFEVWAEAPHPPISAAPVQSGERGEDKR